MKPRPTVTSQIIDQAAKKLSPQYDLDPKKIIENYQYGVWRDLLNSPVICFEDDKELLNLVRDMEAIISRDLRDKEIKWVSENNIQPTLPNGTKLERGIIAGACEHSPAYYKVKEYGCEHDGHYLLVKFEDAIPINCNMSAAQ